MNVQPSEIDSVEEVGILNGSPVKMIRTRGGFYICIGKLQNKRQDEALAAGSHPAIVKYNMEKQHPNFQPIMLKSEISLNTSVVNKHSHFLPENLTKSGHDIYSVQSGSNVEFQVTKHDVRIGTVKATMENGTMVINEMDISEEFSNSLAGAAAEKALSCGTSKVKIQGK